MKISANYYDYDWLELKLIDEKSEKWKDGIKVIEDRFRSRFFTQMDKIKYEKFSGFIIMSVNCLIIETLMQFYLGAKDTETYYKNQQRLAFRDFFKNSQNFNQYFSSDDVCFTFHNHFRNGLLHQAETKGKSLIKKDQKNLIEIIKINENIKGIKIDRNKFYENLTIEFKEYLEKLSLNQNNFKGENLRVNAIKKMNFICSNKS